MKPRATTRLPDLIVKAVLILKKKKKRLEFDDIPAKMSVPESSSKLRSTNEAPIGDSTFIPVDPLCFERVL